MSALNKTEIKKFEEVAETDNLDQARKEFVVATKKLDKAAAKRIIHPNLAARKKSQMARLINKKAASAKTAPKAPAK